MEPSQFQIFLKACPAAHEPNLWEKIIIWENICQNEKKKEHSIPIFLFSKNIKFWNGKIETFFVKFWLFFYLGNIFSNIFLLFRHILKTCYYFMLNPCWEVSQWCVMCYHVDTYTYRCPHTYKTNGTKSLNDTSHPNQNIIHLHT